MQKEKDFYINKQAYYYPDVITLIGSSHETGLRVLVKIIDIDSLWKIPMAKITPVSGDGYMWIEIVDLTISTN